MSRQFFHRERGHLPRARQAMQIPLSKWPSGLRDIAFTIRGGTEPIARKLKLKFESAADSLDDFDAAIMRLAGSKHVIFQAYHDSPVNGVHVLAEDPSLATLRYLVRKLDLHPADICWVRPELEENLKKAASHRTSNWAHQPRSFIRRVATGQLARLKAAGRRS